MATHNRDLIEAAEAVTQRLLQMRQLWEDAANNYFEPKRFMLALQNCITTSRTVTFILQSNKARIPNFDAWYQGHVARWSNDPIMKWAKDARNLIEKRGDLETFSQVRGEIIASFLPGPHTDWLPHQLFASPQEIWHAIPRKYFINHVVKNGTLLIERRWVDSSLPTSEVLEALAHVYDDLCSTIIDLLKENGVPVPPLLEQTRPDPMGQLAMDRAIYLSMRDGSISGVRLFKKPVSITKADSKIIDKRYGKRIAWSRLEKAKGLVDTALALFENARIVMARDGHHHTFVFLLKSDKPIEMVAADHPDRATRYVMMRDLAKLARIVGADTAIMVGEIWTAHGDDIPSSGFAADAKNRGEAIMLTAANASGEVLQIIADITRRRFNTRKVKHIGPPRIEPDGFAFVFVPFLQEWGCLDEKAMQKAFEHMEAMGIEAPAIS